MQCKRSKVIIFCVLLLGVAMLLGGVCGLMSLYKASRTCEHTTATVHRVDTRRVYRYRKTRYESEMLLSYPTERYGVLYTYRKVYFPFKKAGDRLSVLYEPNKPRNIRFPGIESVQWLLLLLAGILIEGVIWLVNKKLK